MNEWGVVGVIVVLVGIVSTVTAPIVKLYNAISTLTEQLKGFGQDIKRLEGRDRDIEEKNHASHQDIYNKLNDHSVKIENHETRIKQVENK